MPCYSPLSAFREDNGGISFTETKHTVSSLTFACGQCVGCRLERSRQWASRIMHEAQSHESNSFITLTYDDLNLPSDYSLHYSHFQKFFKRLRKAVPHRTIRYYVAGEYGDNFGRPHFHACIFNYGFPDRKLFKSTSSGNKLYTSDQLSKLWPAGFTSVGDLTFASAAYVARYIMKKVTGNLADNHYEMVDTSTGEIIWRTPEFCRMSLKPGIGASWFDKYKSDVYPSDEVIVNGFPTKPPRYYDQLLDRVDPDMLEEIKMRREVDILRFKFNNTPERLNVKRQVAEAKISNLKRKLK